MKQIIVHYLKPCFPRMGVGFLIKLIGTIMDLCIPYILAYIIDSVIPLKQKRLIFVWGILMIVCSVLAVVFNIIANRMASKVAGDATEQIRNDLFQKTMYLSNRQTDSFTKHSLISRMTTDTYNLHQMIGRMQRLGVRAPILLTGGICVTFTLDAPMASILLATVPALVMITAIVSRKSISMYVDLQDAIDRFVRMVREDIAGIRVIKALSKTDYESEKFKDINREVVERERKNGMVMAVINPSMNMLLNLGMVAVILAGAFRVQEGNTEVGKILAFTTYFTIILHAVMSISKMFTILSKSIASGNRIWQVLCCEEDMERLEEVYENEELKENTDLNGQSDDSYEIEFEHVSFSYSCSNQDDRHGAVDELTSKVNIQDLNFRIRKGETLGIIGEIGSGKSTVINLLMRLYDVNKGRVLIGGKDVRSYDRHSLREKFGVVFQNDTLFEDSISGNVSLGRKLTEEDIKKALLYAQADTFVEKREGKEQESLNIKGANLSGGQKQRILIARALACKPDILVLDDSSSALDYRTDAQLRRGIREYLKLTTMVIIAQRISSVKDADHILVLEEGRAIGYGTHEELLAGCRVYQEISKSQMGRE